jgi:hypothetical protein
MKYSVTLFLILFALLPLGAASQWAWTDKDGRKVFSDRAPSAEVPEKNIIKRPGLNTPQPALPMGGSADSQENTLPAARSAASAAKIPAVDKELAERKKKLEQAQVAERKAEEDRISKARADNCDRARQAQKTLDSGARIGRINSQGENEVLDDAARRTEAKRIQAIVESDCK